MTRTMTFAAVLTTFGAAGLAAGQLALPMPDGNAGQPQLHLLAVAYGSDLELHTARAAPRALSARSAVAVPSAHAARSMVCQHVARIADFELGLSCMRDGSRPVLAGLTPAR